MTFEELRLFLEEETCVFEKTEIEGLYRVFNRTMSEMCYVEELDFYRAETICHYLWELKVAGMIEGFEDTYNHYQGFYNHIMLN